MQSLEDFRNIELPEDIGSFGLVYKNLLGLAEELDTKLRLLKYKHYSPKSEKFIAPNQGQLFNEAEAEADTASSSDDEDENDDDATPVAEHSRKKRRKQFEIAPEVERCRHTHILPEEERLCPCCNEPMAEIGEQSTEKLDLVPPKLMVREDVYKKYACHNKSCDSSPKQAPSLPVAIAKIKVTTAMLAFIATQKYQYSLPLYRLEGLFKTLGATVSRRVMSHWMIKLANAFRPIYLSLDEQLISSNYLHMDESTLQVLREPNRGATTKSYMWVRVNGDPSSPPIVLYHYSESRSAKIAKDLLGDFSGHLQTDDYAGYGSALTGRNDIVHLLCWDHTRRYFYDAYQGIGKNNCAGSTAEQALKLIKKLYKIESRHKGLSDEEVLKARREQSLQTLEKIKVLCEKKLPDLSTKSLTYRAIRYMQDNWEQLLVYTTDARLNISNSPAEQKIRPYAVGRKNWLFANTPSGAEASAIIYSIIQTAQANGLDPYDYIKSTLDRLPEVETTDDLAALLPVKQN